MKKLEATFKFEEKYESRRACHPISDSIKVNVILKINYVEKTYSIQPPDKKEFGFYGGRVFGTSIETIAPRWKAILSCIDAAIEFAQSELEP